MFCVPNTIAQAYRLQGVEYDFWKIVDECNLNRKGTLEEDMERLFKKHFPTIQKVDSITDETAIYF